MALSYHKKRLTELINFMQKKDIVSACMCVSKLSLGWVIVIA